MFWIREWWLVWCSIVVDFESNKCGDGEVDCSWLGGGVCFVMKRGDFIFF